MTGSYQELLESNFGFPFPDDFFRFQDFLEELKSRGLSLVENSLGISPANVFQIFEGASQTSAPASLETAFYKDPPEFVTLLLGDVDGLHWGYYADTPGTLPYPVAHYYQNDSFELEIDGDLFDAVANHAGDVRQNLEDLIQSDPGSAGQYRERIHRIDAVLEILATYHKHSPIARRVTAPTRDGMGIVVPDELYAPLLPEDPFQDASYRPTNDEVRHFQELAFAALRNGHPGTALKLGKDLWDYVEFFDVSYELLDNAYTALARPLLKKRLEYLAQQRKEMSS